MNEVNLFFREDKDSSSSERKYLDRRRFEDGFLLYAVRKICKKYEIPTVNLSITSRNDLLDKVTERFYDGFVKKWGGEHKTFY